ncbi:hypothetical protein [Defluviimonas sp. SAOS-178_SWC]|uniref:hypothetical protein n=1 Tax=Defluviimonas sp. SAOS-178_SWC TaxID=3121287 RepID=UPI003222034D
MATSDTTTLAAQGMSGIPATQTKSLSDCQTDAIYLHGLMQGIEELMDSVTLSLSPAANATHALIHVAAEKAEQLKDGLERLEMMQRNKAR